MRVSGVLGVKDLWGWLLQALLFMGPTSLAKMQFLPSGRIAPVASGEGMGFSPAPPSGNQVVLVSTYRAPKLQEEHRPIWWVRSCRGPRGSHITLRTLPPPPPWAHTEGLPTGSAGEREPAGWAAPSPGFPTVPCSVLSVC